MAIRSKYLCQECQKEFDATCGDRMKAKEFRCIDCDNIKYIENEKLNEFDCVCEKCKGHMEVIKFPMCPFCKKRNNKSVEMLLMID